MNIVDHKQAHKIIARKTHIASTSPVHSMIEIMQDKDMKNSFFQRYERNVDEQNRFLVGERLMRLVIYIISGEEEEDIFYFLSFLLSDSCFPMELSIIKLRFIFYIIIKNRL